MKVLKFFSLIGIFMFCSLGLMAQDKSGNRESFSLLQQNYGGQAPYIIRSPSAWHYGVYFYNYHTHQRIHEQELNKLLNSAPGNEKYKVRNTAYTSMTVIGAIVAFSGLMIPLAYKAKKQTMPKAARDAAISLGAIGTTTGLIFGLLYEHNRAKAIDNYNTYVVGLKRKF